MIPDDTGAESRPGVGAEGDGTPGELTAVILLLAYPVACISYVKGSPLFGGAGLQAELGETFLGSIETLAEGPRLALAFLFALGALASALWFRAKDPTWAVLVAIASLAAIVLGASGSFALVSVAGLIASVILLGASGSVEEAER